LGDPIFELNYKLYKGVIYIVFYTQVY